MNPKWPVFIPSKGRHASRYTMRAFDIAGVPYKCVVEPQEFDAYAKHIPETNLIVLPFSEKGLVATRNWIWDHAVSIGVEYFWTFDDNISSFYRLNQNTIIKCHSGAHMLAMEDFTARYENLAISGMHYEMFVRRRFKCAPVQFNTRVYSNMLIKTNIPYRNHGVFNDDTDLCLRVLKDGWCTALFQAFLVKKIATMKVKGGMTPLYQGNGRLKMAQELQQAHPDVTKIIWKWGRWQHQVDYRAFKGNSKPGINLAEMKPNEYGMKLTQVKPIKSKTLDKLIKENYNPER